MILVLGVGNELRGDDAFGLLVVKELKKKIKSPHVILWSGEAPENFIGEVKGTVDKLIVIDTALLGKKPGTLGLVKPEMISKQAISTHKLPLSLLAEILEPKEAYFICAQPKTTEFGAKPSKEILSAVKEAEKLVLKIISSSPLP